MMSKLRLCFAGVMLLLLSSFAQASFVPISVFPNPVQFGTVAEFSTGYLSIYVTNITANSVTIAGMSLSGANSADFGLSTACVVAIDPGQTCAFQITFTPSATGSRSATLQVTVLGLSQPVNFSVSGTGGNPLPVITSISPATAYVNSAALTLTVNGTGFANGAVVYWNNSNALTTTYVSSTKLTAQLPASDLTYTGSYWIDVANPDGNYSGIVYFDVITLDPSISNASPSTVLARSTPTPVVVNGSNFMTGATILWNGKPMSTTYLSSSQLQATPTAAQLKSASIVQLSVSNPAPGGVSSTINFDVTYQAKVTTLDLPANDLVWDPYAQRIYASLPSSYGTNGNSIAVINPVNGRITGYYFAGSEPNQLALSADSKYLYVGLNGNGSVQRLNLPGFTPDIDVSLGNSIYGGLNTALSLQVYPGDSHSFAVAEGTVNCCGTSGLYFFKDATQLPNYITYPTFNDFVFASSSTMYGYYSSTVGQVTVDSNGGTLGLQWSNLVQGSAIAYDNGLIYGNAGQVFNPTTGLLVGSYDVSSSYCCSNNPLMPDSAIDRVFVFGTTPFFNALGVTAYDLSRFTPVAVANLSQLSGTPTQNFIRWGNSGLAGVLTPGCCSGGANQVVLVQSSSMLMTSSATSNPAPAAQSLSPSTTNHGAGNFVLTLQGKNFVPGSQVTWNGTSLFADYVSPTQLHVYVPASSVAAAGTAKLVVTNPAPGGGTSSLTFTIN